MNLPPIRVFLFSNAPELLPLLHRIEERLRDQPPATYEPVLAAPVNRAPGSRGLLGREMQEGDMLISVAVPEGADDALRAAHDQALGRKLIVFPFILARAPEEPSPAIAGATDERFETTLLDAHDGIAKLSDAIVATVNERVIMGSIGTDLLARWMVEPRHADPLRTDALEALSNDGAEATGHLQKVARETRVQAATAIRARLFEIALETLHRAAEHDATSAITAYWAARLQICQNLAGAHEEGLRAATRAARLARLQSKGSAIEIASWRLAAKIAAMAGDSTGLREYLREANSSAAGLDNLLLEDLRLMQQVGLESEGIAMLEALYAEDRKVLYRIAGDPQLATFHAHLRNLQANREAHLRGILGEVNACRETLHRTRGLKPPSPPRGAADEALAGGGSDEVFDRLEEATSEGVRTQLDLLNAWGNELIQSTRGLNELRRRRLNLEAASREMPARSEFDMLLERLWPRLRKRYQDLSDALGETDRLHDELMQSETEAMHRMRKETRQFVKCAEAFESLLVRHPHLASACAGDRAAAAGTLAVLKSHAEDSSDPYRRHNALLPDDVCQILNFPNPTTDAEALYRLHRDANGREGASRAGVYFPSKSRTRIG